MPNNWKTYTLDEICNRITDGSHSSPKEVKNGNYQIATVKDMNDYGFYLEQCKRISDKDFESLKNQDCVPEKGDVLFSKDGTIGKVLLFNFDYKIGVLSSIAIFRPKEELIDSLFLSYYLKEQTNNNFIKDNFRSGSAIPRIILRDFKKYNLTVPELSEQKSIASILSTIDDKIENNLAINKTLEEMAMALYKHWFVDFGPFQDCEFVESELGRIPKGWEVKKIGEVIETLGGGTPSTTTKEYWEDGDILWYSPTDLTRENSLFSFDTAKKITALGLQKSSAKMFPANSLLMSSRATIGLLTINTKEACTNQGFITMLPNDKLSVYQLYFWVKDNMDLIISKANGSTFKEISKSNFRDLEIVVPNSIENYIEQSKDIFEQIKNNTSENQTLIQLRDTLLPKLISGEVRLKEFREESITN